MFPLNFCLLRAARPTCCVLLGAWLLSGCESGLALPDLDLLPPTLFEKPAEKPAPVATAGDSPVAREQSGDWISTRGTIFDWRAEGLVGTRATARDDEPAPVDTPATTVSPAPTAPVVVTLKPALRLGDTTTATADTAPPVAGPTSAPTWQTNAGPIFDWAAEARTEPAPESAAEPQPLSAWQLREQQMRGLVSWRLNGRVALSSPQESWSAVLRWEQVGDAFHVRLSNPLGQGLLDLRGVPGEVLMRTAEGQIYRAPSAETLLRDVAGMNLPVSGLRYWLLAVTDPAAAAANVNLDGDSLPVWVEQAGWRIEYDRYRETDGLRLPDRLSFQGDDLDGRLIVTQWDLQGS